ncbi:hypothetical protein [Campylobacter concisus]|uniref:hypothetical protein n=1 Tax=Campylobacter concisus TaxID=199 RepID=UPI000CD91348|nr:hypothetical protein [Campylobacter concisus]
MQNDDALNDLSLDAEPKKEGEIPTLKNNYEIWLKFFARAFFSYLPLSVYIIVNIPYFTTPPQDEQPFLKGLFLALSYVFVSQSNMTYITSEVKGSLLLGAKIFLGILCIAFFATDKFAILWWHFIPFLIASFMTLYYTIKN